ncbi:hypothetical protein DPMN_080036 [Dreissena polymorpha]|uniref:Uncharacterized protein n=1 Tax=Dreissena polymorpha TaxID=45954 RepID=A0A9D4BQM3_DREPO|nr:hypothetical protein DPMN_080036 [Dreissena polymorpha]
MRNIRADVEAGPSSVICVFGICAPSCVWVKAVNLYIAGTPDASHVKSNGCPSVVLVDDTLMVI